MKHPKIIPCIWLSAHDGKLTDVIHYYQQVFGANLQVGTIIPLGSTPSGYSEMCHIEVFGHKYALMNTAKEHHPLNDAISLMISCADQQEIDHFWDYFTLEGKPSQCGWCQDKYGLRWQIIPENLGQLMREPNAMEVMMKQQKIKIEDFFNH